MQMSVKQKVKSFLKGFFAYLGNTEPEVPPKEVLARRENMSCMEFKYKGFTGYVYGGPYMNRPTYLIGVKMAEEIKYPHEISIPTKDFSVPKEGELLAGVMTAMAYLKKHGELYVGCMGGIGRTGLFMATLARLMEEEGELGICEESSIPPSVQYVRDQYNGHAVETKEQVQYIKNLDLRNLKVVADTLFA